MKTNDFFKTIGDISNAPSQNVKNFARCNRPYQSKFYCSENRPTSYWELVEDWAETKKVGEKIYVTIGEWVLKKSLTAIIVTTPDIADRTSEFDKWHGSIMDKRVSNFDKETQEAMVIFYRYLFKNFRKPAKNDTKTYIITSAYCNLALSHSSNSANGIFYPSIPYQGQGLNLALNADFVTSDNIELNSILRNEFTVYENENKKISFAETGKLKAINFDTTKNLIVWEN